MKVYLFKPRFAQLVLEDRKRQTVRPPRTYPPKVGELISLRQWEGVPYHSKQRFLRVVRVASVETLSIYPRGAIARDGRFLGGPGSREFARDDGFTDLLDFICWFAQAHGLPFHGELTTWTAANP